MDMRLVLGSAVLGSSLYLLRVCNQKRELTRRRPVALDAVSMPFEPSQWLDGLRPDYNDEHDQRKYERPSPAGGPVPPDEFADDFTALAYHIVERSKEYDLERLEFNTPWGEDQLYFDASDRKTDFDPINRDL